MTYCFSEPSSSSSSSSSPQQQPQTPPPPHVYKPTQPIIEEDLDSYIYSYKDHSLKYVCQHPDCKGRRDSKTKQHHLPAIFTSKSNARNHVRRDLNIVDAFQCSCGQTFGSEDSAKRHCNTKSAGKVHECPECGHGFERKDYWEVHVKERKCRRGNRVSPPHQQQQPQHQHHQHPQIEYSPSPQPSSTSSTSSSSDHLHHPHPHAHHSFDFNLHQSYTHYNPYPQQCSLQYPMHTMDYAHVAPGVYSSCPVYYN